MSQEETLAAVVLVGHCSIRPCEAGHCSKEEITNNITKEYFVDHPAIICSHPNFSRSGDLLTTQDLLLPPQASHLFSDLLLLKANVLVDFKSRTESLYVELTPVKPNEYEIRVYNPTSSQITINQGDVVGMIVSNIKARVHRMNRANFEHTTLNKYVLPI